MNREGAFPRAKEDIGVSSHLVFLLKPGARDRPAPPRLWADADPPLGGAAPPAPRPASRSAAGRPAPRPPPASVSPGKRGAAAFPRWQSTPRAQAGQAARCPTQQRGARRGPDGADGGEAEGAGAPPPPSRVAGGRLQGGPRAAPSPSVVPGEPRPWRLLPLASSSRCAAVPVFLLFVQPMAREILGGLRGPGTRSGGRAPPGGQGRRARRAAGLSGAHLLLSLWF